MDEKGYDFVVITSVKMTAEAAVAEAKKKYDAALDELEKLITKKKQLDDKRILEAYHASSKTAEGIVAFLNSEK